MSYPLYSQREVFIPAISGGAINLVTSGITTDALTAGQVGIFKMEHGITGASINAATTVPVFFGVGSYHTVDAISPALGGLLESNKSKTVDFRTVSRFWKKVGQAARNMVISVGWDQTTSGSTSTVGPLFQCGTFYRLLVEAKGSPALRTLAHELYRDIEAYTGCCAGNCASGCTGEYVDSVTVMLQWSDYIKQDPILSQFLAPIVYWNNSGTKTRAYSAYDVTLPALSGQTAYTPNTSTPETVVSCIQLTAAYVDTTFGNCTFTPSDHYELEPLLLYASLRMDDGSDSDPCQVITTINTSVPNMVSTITTPRQLQGSGETVLREWIAYLRKKTETFADGYAVELFRMREIENDVTLTNITRSAIYDEIHIMYQVMNAVYNPSSIVDNTVYESVFYVPTGTTTTTFTTLITNCLAAVGNSVTLETIPAQA